MRQLDEIYITVYVRDTTCMHVQAPGRETDPLNIRYVMTKPRLNSNKHEGIIAARAVIN